MGILKGSNFLPKKKCVTSLERQMQRRRSVGHGNNNATFLDRFGDGFGRRGFSRRRGSRRLAVFGQLLFYFDRLFQNSVFIQPVKVIQLRGARL